MPTTDLTNPQPASEPLLSVGTITAAVTAVIGLAVSFGFKLSGAQQAAILGVVAVVAPLAVAVWGRRKVFSPATVAKNYLPKAPAPVASTVSLTPVPPAS